ncbi:MAG: right-handed parallel beta-helix repeat-containing protein, partial [Candidatus Coatesbacteria bacterium]|nr:right-handed parallel beta-helix repeat-containing protein [Candidatus Coatesbacteria bacterium]
MIKGQITDRVFVGLILAVLLAAPVFAGTDYYVDKANGDDGNSGLSWEDAFRTIQKGIDACNTGIQNDPDVAHVAAETYYENISLDSYVTLLGGYPPGGGDRDWEANPTIIDGGSNSFVVALYEGEAVRIDGFTITKGKSQYGGGIHCGKSSLHVLNCAVQHNEAYDEDTTYTYDQKAWGGGIYSYTSTIAFVACTISDNEASAYANSGGAPSYTGGADVCGGGIYFRDCTSLVLDCKISRNTACAYSSSDDEAHSNYSHAYGGGAYLENCTAAFVHCEVGGNVAHAIAANRGSYSTSSGSDRGHSPACPPPEHYAYAYGGGFYYYAPYCDSRPVLLDCLVAQNQVIADASSHGYQKEDNRAGGVYCYRCSVNLENCAVTDNNKHGIYADKSDPSLTDCIFWGNEDDLAGMSCPLIKYCDIGDGDCEGENGNISMDPLFVAEYHLSQTAAGQSSQSPCVDAGSDDAAALALEDRSTRTDNVPDGGVVDMGYHYPSSAGNHNPVLAWGRVTPEEGTDEATFTFSVYYHDREEDAPTIRDVYIDGTSHEMNLDSGYPADGTYTFETKLAEGDHSFCFYFEDGNGGRARDPRSDSYSGPKVGSSKHYYVDKTNGSDSNSGLSWDDAFASIQKGLNECAGSGGPDTVCVAAATYYETIWFDGSEYDGIILVGGYPSGGGRRDQEANPTIISGDNGDRTVWMVGACGVELDGFTITHASGSIGGGVVIRQGSQDISNCVICNNIIDGNGAFGSCGAGIWSEDASPRISNCIIRDNTGYTYAGGILFATSTTDSSRPEVLDCMITNNRCADSSSGDGGGVAFLDYGGRPSHITMKRCVITNNSPGSAQAAGGMLLATADISDCLIANNAGAKAISVEVPDSTTFRNCTIADNDGNGIYTDPSVEAEIQLTNCILWGNEDDLQWVDCAGVSHCDIEDGDCEGENGNFSENPRFISGHYLCQIAAGQNYQSPCVDAGDDDAETYGLNKYTTRTDGIYDEGVVDLGYHYEEGTDYKNSNPVLSDGNVDPESGTFRTTFTYSIHFLDVDGDQPTVKKVYIDYDSGHDMTLDSGDSADGAYVFVTKLSSGNHSFYFYFETENGDSARAPESGAYDGPTVTEAPVLSDGAVDPRSGTSETGFAFSVYYWEEDGSAPSVIKAFIDGDSGHDMALDSGQAAAGTYSFQTTLSVGEHDFYFYCEYGDAHSGRDPESGVHDGPNVSDDPVLSDGGVVPDSGTTKTTFAYSVHYSDPCADPPSIARVFIDEDSGHEMTLAEGDPADGVYVFETPLAPGSHDFYFYFENEAGYGDREPPTGAHDGPYVQHDPVLSDSEVAPESGTAQTSFTYSVHYYQAEGSAPSVLKVFVDDAGHDMTLDAGDPADGRYICETALDSGEHNFYIYCEDQNGTGCRAPETSAYDGPYVQPDLALQDGHVNPESGRISTVFTYCVHCMGYDGEPPSVARVYIDDTGFIMSLESGDPDDGIYSYETAIALGQHEFYFYFERAAGGSARLPRTGSFSGPTAYDDDEAPNSSCTAPQTANCSPIDVHYMSSDGGSGVASVALYMQHNNSGFFDSGHVSGNATGSFSVELDSGDGIYEFYTIARDSAGNTESPPEEADASVEADLTAPLSSCWADEFANAVPFAVRFEASDSYSGVKETRLWYRWAGESQWQNPWLVATGESGVFVLDPTQVTPEFGDGVYELMTIATDNMGNNETPPLVADALIILDRTPPETTVECLGLTATSPLKLDYTATDPLTGTGIAHVSMRYRYEGGQWQDTGLWSDTDRIGTFEFALEDGDGIYEFMCVATDIADNSKLPTGPQAMCIFDTHPPSTTAQSDEVVNDPAINITFASADSLTEVAAVHLYYRYTDLGGNPDDTLRDTELEVGQPSGSFGWLPDMGPGYYGFIISATDEAGNTEGTGGPPDATCLFDPRLALSEAHAAAYCTTATIRVSFEVDVGQDGYDYVALYYRYEAEQSASHESESGWVTAATVSHLATGSIPFACEHGDGYYHFCTRARTESGLWEPAPRRPDATTIADTVAPQTKLSAPAISPTSEFDLTLSTIEPYGMASVEIYCWHAGQWSLFTTVSDPDGIVAFDAHGNEGEYRFYSVGTDMAGNVEQKVPEEDCCSTLLDLLPPISAARAESFGTAFPIEVTYAATDAVTEVVSVALWARFESSEWADTGLSSTSSSGVFNYNPASAEAKQGTYYFYTAAVDEMGHIEEAPVSADTQTIIDWTPPVTSCSAPPYSRNGLIELAYSASDALSGISSVVVWVKPDDTAWVDAGLSRSSDEGVIEVDVSAFGEGAFSLCVRGLDKAGNREGLPEAPPTSTIYDATAPESRITLPAEGIYADHAPVDVPFAASDLGSGVVNVELWFRFDGGSWTNSGLVGVPSHLNEGTFAFTPPSGDGTYEFASLSIDKAGNRELIPDAPDGGALTFDQTSPTSAVSFNGVYARAFPIILSFQAQDETSSIANVALFVSISGSAYSDTGLSASGVAGNFEFTPDVIADGVYR